MKWWIGLAAKLYPRAWRDRYGMELSALLEDMRPGWREFRDLIRGAVLMQMTHGSDYLKMTGAVALLGAIVAATVSLSVPERYASAAVLRIISRQATEPPDNRGANPSNLDDFTEIEQEVLKGSSLAELITRPSLDLYRNERQRLPLDQIIGKMRRDIRFHWLRIAQGSAVQISFSILTGKRRRQWFRC